MTKTTSKKSHQAKRKTSSNPKKKPARLTKDPAKTPAAEKASGKAALSPPEQGNEEVKESPVTQAEVSARKQRDISVSEFFLKNRHLLGFDNPKKALLTTVKEAVDNSLDACEEAKIFPEINVEINQIAEDRFHVITEDNGPGIVREQIPKIYGKLLYGSKFHSMKQSRGQQGIGISAAGMYGQLTTGTATKITSRISPKKQAHYFEIMLDSNRNVPVIVKDEISDWKKPHGTRVDIELEAKFQKGRHSIEDYIRQTALANPHLSITFKAPDGETFKYQASSKKLPIAPKEIKPHPHGVELGILMKMLKSTTSRRVQAFLSRDFTRVSGAVAKRICDEAGISGKASPSRIAHQEADKLYRTINNTKIMNPPTNCLSPIGEEELIKGLKRNVNADFFTALTRAPSVYRGNPFQIEVALAYGGDMPSDELADVVRFANRVPLMYQQSACAITKSVLQTSWKNYGVDQSRGALPTGPLLVLVHMSSVWVPFTSESKEAVASYEEIMKEVKLGLQECARRLHAFIRKGRKDAEAKRKKDYIRKYLPHIGIGLREILSFKQTEQDKILHHLTQVLEKERA